MALKFYNPALLAASPEVAVQEAPQSSYEGLGLAIIDGMKEIRNTVQKKRDVDALRRETDALAEYVGARSPQLSAYLKTKASQYDLFTTDPAKERAGLLSGTVSLFDSETRRTRAEKDANALLRDNNWRYKVQAADKHYEMLLRDKQRWEEQKNIRESKHNALRAKLAESGKDLAPLPEETYPGQGDLDNAEKKALETADAGPAAIYAASTPKSGQGTGTGLFGGLPVDGTIPDDSYEPQPDMPSGVDNNAETLLDPGAKVPDSVKVQPRTPQLTEDPSSSPPGWSPPMLLPDNKASEPTATEPPVSSTPPLLTPSNQPPKDEISVMAEENKALLEEAAKVDLIEVDNILNSAERQAPYATSAKALKEVLDKREAVKAQIAGLKGLSPKIRQAKVNTILASLRKDVQAVIGYTAPQYDRLQRDANAAAVRFQAKGDSPDKTFPGSWKQIGGQKRYMMYDANIQREVDITPQINKGEIIVYEKGNPNDPASPWVQVGPPNLSDKPGTTIPGTPTPAPPATTAPPISNSTSIVPPAKVAPSNNVNVATPGAVIDDVLLNYLRTQGLK